MNTAGPGSYLLLIFLFCLGFVCLLLCLFLFFWCTQVSGLCIDFFFKFRITVFKLDDNYFGNFLKMITFGLYICKEDFCVLYSAFHISVVV